MLNQTIQLRITGMTCGHCEKMVSNTLQESAGVNKVTVNLQAGTATVDFDDDKTNVEQLTAAVNDTGIYHVTEAITDAG